MPYIIGARRHDIDQGYVHPTNPGDLNYAITKLIWRYFVDSERDYQAHNDIVGALDNAKDEWKRRVQNNYEDMKCAENGDVYT